MKHLNNNPHNFDVAVIIPVYNAEHYLNRCIDSLINQTFDINCIQVILINNNSTDKSVEICEAYSRQYNNIQLYHEESPGPSFARNTGLRNVDSKYIMFLDADDYLSNITIKNVVDFFEKHYHEVDLVSYHETRYEAGNSYNHMRYKYLKNTGIYDLDKTIFALQVRLNICIKSSTNLLFDETMIFQEDQKFCSEILKSKRKLGYVKEAEYHYEMHDAGLVDQNQSSLYCFETSTKLFEDIFSSFTGDVPKYYQALFLHDSIWKFKSNKFWPFQYSGNEFLAAKQRIINLLDKVDLDVIYSYPNIDIYEKMYWIRLKSNLDISCYINTDGIKLVNGSDIFYTRKDIELVLKKVKLIGNTYKILGFFKSEAFNFWDKPHAFITVNNKPYDLELTDCGAGYYKVKEKTDTFWGIDFSVLLDSEYIEIKFFLEVENIPINITFYNTEQVPFSKTPVRRYICKEYECIQKDNSITLIKRDNEYIDAFREAENNSIYKDYALLKHLRENISKKSTGKIWLYSDGPSVRCDNAFFQYQNDKNINDGIERYYVITNDDFPENQDNSCNYIYARSLTHLELFFQAEKILTSFAEEDVYWPLVAVRDRQLMRDMFNAEVVYLQHGVLHAHLPWYYSKTMASIDKVVISTYFEKGNLINQYDFKMEDLYCTGMARYDLINRTASPCKKILFAPSWRSYLVQKRDANSLKRGEKDITSFSYYKNIIKLLSSKKLFELLDQNDFELDVKLHPEFLKVYQGIFSDLSNTRINILDQEVDLTQYQLMITDFSSMLYDFLYLKRPIMYFIPDHLEFISGMNHYRALDIPLTDGFGELSTSVNQTIKLISQYMKNDFQISSPYREKIDNLFFDITDARKHLYNNLVNQ